MGFLDNDLANKAKEQFGEQAADAAQKEASTFIGADAAGSVIGGLSGALGIQRTATATAGAGVQNASTDVPDDGDQPDDDDSSDDDSSDDDDSDDDSSDDDNSDDDDNS